MSYRLLELTGRIFYPFFWLVFWVMYQILMLTVRFFWFAFWFCYQTTMLLARFFWNWLVALLKRGSSSVPRRRN